MRAMLVHHSTASTVLHNIVCTSIAQAEGITNAGPRDAVCSDWITVPAHPSGVDTGVRACFIMQRVAEQVEASDDPG